MVTTPHFHCRGHWLDPWSRKRGYFITYTAAKKPESISQLQHIPEIHLIQIFLALTENRDAGQWNFLIKILKIIQTILERLLEAFRLPIHFNKHRNGHFEEIMLKHFCKRHLLHVSVYLCVVEKVNKWGCTHIKFINPLSIKMNSTETLF